MPELLVELFSEEIPARMQLRAAEDLQILAEKYLGEAGFADLKLETFVTPRRLTLIVHNLPAQQPDRSIEIKGPRVDAPEQALTGFMQANGLTSLGGIEQRAVGKATHYFITRNEKGRKTSEILPEMIAAIIQQFPWPKSMRWGSGTQVWVRPLQRVNVMFDGKAIMGSGEFNGHRFLSPKPFKANNFEKYKSELKKHHVILDQTERRTEILNQIQKIATEKKLSLRDDAALLDEVTGLVEWPTAMLGTFEKEYLQVPQECLIATMRANQKYFPLFDATGGLANHFIVIANVPGTNGPAPIVHGNERVLRARLSDAKFFYDQDLKVPLESRIEKLKTIQFHEKLGTLFEKATRVTAIAQKLADALKADARLAQRAAQLCKADLTTGMVGEFPELQGIMGRYYAEHDKEPKEVCDAIRDHYQPLGPTAAVPTAPISIIVALADKLDTLNEFFRIGEKPTGSKDPYALRRAALGIIRIIIENSLRIPLSQFAEGDVLDFIRERLKYYLRDDQKLPQDACAAALGTGDDLLLIKNKVQALGQFIRTPNGMAVLALTKRASNILKIEEKKDSVAYSGKVHTSLFKNNEEKQLHDKVLEIEEHIKNDLAAEQYIGVIYHLAWIQLPLDSFFEKTLVNDPDPKIRANRLNLLGQIRSVFHQFADFSQIEG